jgi:DNA-binding MarR family transcriptional regulator/GNAT superfamily N-acetyltransferase
VRVLYELAQREAPMAADIARDLGLDPGHLSRILRAFHGLGLIQRRRSAKDGRQSLLALTASGSRTYRALDIGASRQVATVLGRLPPTAQANVVRAMHAIAAALDESPPAAPEPYILRGPQPGDLGWVVHRHGALYAAEHGYSQRFEALVARIVADFVEKYDERRDRCFLAERQGEVVGSVFVVHEDDAAIARLRLLLVEPSARGLGLGARLVQECLRFARQAGYRTLTLWTQRELGPARRLYKNAGFRLRGTKTHTDFGKKLVGETWSADLTQAAET